MSGGDLTVLVRLANLVANAEQLDQACAAAGDGSYCELEVRLGQFDAETKTFVSGVSVETHERIAALFPKTPEEKQAMAWFESATDGCVETHDYFYESGAGLPPYRTRVIFDSDGEREPRLQHVTKVQVDRVDVLLSSPLESRFCDCIRVSLAREDPVPDEMLPVIATTSRVRIKRTMAYRYVSRNMHSALWEYHLSWVWQGQTHLDADLALNRSPTTPSVYEVEIECLSPTRYRQAQHQNPEFVAESLIRKAVNLYTAGDSVTEDRLLREATLAPAVVATAAAGQPSCKRRKKQ